MAKTVANEVRKYLDGLTATSNICVSFGTTLTSGTNLFMYVEPGKKVNMITIIPYSSGPPTPEGNRHDNSFQLRVKHSRNASCVETGQALINILHNNTKVCASVNGRVSARQSSPIPLEIQEGGEYMIVVANFGVKHIKI